MMSICTALLCVVMASASSRDDSSAMMQHRVRRSSYDRATLSSGNGWHRFARLVGDSDVEIGLSNIDNWDSDTEDSTVNINGQNVCGFTIVDVTNDRSKTCKVWRGLHGNSGKFEKGNMPPTNKMGVNSINFHTDGRSGINGCSGFYAVFFTDWENTTHGESNKGRFQGCMGDARKMCKNNNGGWYDFKVGCCSQFSGRTHEPIWGTADPDATWPYHGGPFNDGPWWNGKKSAGGVTEWWYNDCSGNPEVWTRPPTPEPTPAATPAPTPTPVGAKPSYCTKLGGPVDHSGKTWLKVVNIKGSGQTHVNAAETSDKLSDADINTLRGDGILWFTCSGSNAYIHDTTPFTSLKVIWDEGALYKCSTSPDSQPNANTHSKGGASYGIDCWNSGVNIVYQHNNDNGCLGGTGSLEGSLYVEYPKSCEAPTPAPASSARSTADPHMTNVMDQHFDLFRTGTMRFLQVPRMLGGDVQSKLTVDGRIDRIASRKKSNCNHQWLRNLLMSGTLLGKSYEFGVDAIKNSLFMRADNVSTESPEEFMKLAPESVVTVNPMPLNPWYSYHSTAKLFKVVSSVQLQAGSAKLTMELVHQAKTHNGREHESHLNFDAKNLKGLVDDINTIGGLLGVDDHTADMNPQLCQTDGESRSLFESDDNDFDGSLFHSTVSAMA